MSRYAQHDAGEWVQAQIESIKQRSPTKREREAAADHRGWYGAPVPLNDFHRKAMTILGIVGGGIYNAPIAWNNVHWWNNQVIVPWQQGHGLGTWDFDQLTNLVFLCHVGRIRGYIGPQRGRGMEIFLSERVAEGPIAKRHPNLEQAVQNFYGWFAGDHPLTYPGDKPPALALASVRAAIGDYHHALDTREHGGLSAHRALDKIQDVLGMTWVQGATLKEQPTDKVST